jgi:hypothetical protein
MIYEALVPPTGITTTILLPGQTEAMSNQASNVDRTKRVKMKTLRNQCSSLPLKLNADTNMLLLAVVAANERAHEEKWGMSNKL